MREQVADLGQAGGVGRVADDGVHFEFLGGHLEIVSAGADQRDRVAGVAEPFSNGATQFGVAAGD